VREFFYCKAIDILVPLWYNGSIGGIAMNENEKNVIITAETAPKPKRKTHTSSAVNMRYRKKVYTRVGCDVPKQLAADFKAATLRDGVKTRTFMIEAMQEYLKKHPL
jgi:paraquat-inducible protein B